MKITKSQVLLYIILVKFTIKSTNLLSLLNYTMSDITRSNDTSGRYSNAILEDKQIFRSNRSFSRIGVI